MGMILGVSFFQLLVIFFDFYLQARSISFVKNNILIHINLITHLSCQYLTCCLAPLSVKSNADRINSSVVSNEWSNAIIERNTVALLDP